MLTVAQAAERLGISTRKVYDMVYAGELASIELPGTTGTRSSRRVERAEVDAYIERNRVTGRGAS